MKSHQSGPLLRPSRQCATTRIATSLEDLTSGWAIVATKLPIGRDQMDWSYSLDPDPFRLAVAAGVVTTAQRYDQGVPVLLAKRVGR